MWSIPVPIPKNSLRYVLVYAMETDRGPYIVDAGWNTDESFKTLSDGLDRAGFAMADVQGVLVTHIHPDHYGLAGRIREASGAWVALHPADAALIQDRYREPDHLIAEMGAQLNQLGVPDDERELLQSASMPVRPYVWAVEPDILMEDGDKPEIPGWDVQAIWTPGHSPGHLCFWEAGNRLMLSGDHVLPRITPNISLHPQSGDDPLGQFMDSLDKVGAYDADEVLPAHEHRFVNLAGRVDQLKAHHEERMLEAVEAVRSGADTAWQIAERMAWSRSWNRIEGFMRRSAVTETFAHLRLLERRGTLRLIDGVPLRWELASP